MLNTYMYYIMQKTISILREYNSSEASVVTYILGKCIVLRILRCTICLYCFIIVNLKFVKPVTYTCERIIRLSTYQ